jgi:hypothetical protein
MTTNLKDRTMITLMEVDGFKTLIVSDNAGVLQAAGAQKHTNVEVLICSPRQFEQFGSLLKPALAPNCKYVFLRAGLSESSPEQSGIEIL